MLILLGFKANAQGTISGVVKDAETGEFVIGAYITSGAETVATDFMGKLQSRIHLLDLPEAHPQTLLIVVMH